MNQVLAKRVVKKQQMRWSDKNRTGCCKCERQRSTRSLPTLLVPVLSPLQPMMRRKTRRFAFQLWCGLNPSQ
jgi:hypothetical protein